MIREVMAVSVRSGSDVDVTESSAAAARAWEAYTMINPTAKDDEVRHAALARFVEERSAAD